MKILWFSDFDVKGSGYQNISVPVCTGLSNLGHEVICIGFGYKGEEHFYPFRIIPCTNFLDAYAMFHNLNGGLWQFDVVIVAFDINLQEGILNNEEIKARKYKYFGIMPIEADPLGMRWAMVLMQMDRVFVISQFGTDEALAKGIEAEHLRIGIDTDIWRFPTPEEKSRIRLSMLGIDDDYFVILTVADNQERKNLGKAMEIFAEFSEGKDNVKWVLVTREHQAVGWDLRGLGDEFGINQKFMIFERGMSFKELWSLYAASDCFLLTSKAEGLGMPILEAMAVGLPVLATNCTGMEELLADGRGIPLEYDYTYIDPFGNGNRYFTSRESGVKNLNDLYSNKGIADELIKKARKYVEERDWNVAIQQIDIALKEIENGEEIA